ncbi:MAG TPA: metallophosphoesterase [Chthonomonadaceae bacterium]|nr:metallophosphoesterase [Chthonomonadaceae bacterium]
MPTLNLLVMSDIHCRFAHFAPARLPDADLAIVAGDLTNDGVSRPEPASSGLLAWLIANGRRPEELLETEPQVDRAAAWLTELAERHPVFWVPGNHDIGITAATFSDIPNCTCILDRTVQFAGQTFHGVSLSPGDSFLARRWDYMTDDPTVEEAAFDFEPADIVVSHCPPYGGVTDQSADASGVVFAHYGSPALRAYIERCAPRLVICGHVHEAERREQIGRTLVYNTAERWTVLKMPVSAAAS